MKVTIRKGVFETNSSSTHAICISKDSNYKIDRTHISFVTGGYGWQWDKHIGTTSKASYLITALLDCCRDDLMEQMFAILTKNGITYDVLRTSECYIDHCYELTSFIEKICVDEDLLLRYLFLDDSYVITGNDNDYIEIGYPSEMHHDIFVK